MWNELKLESFHTNFKIWYSLDQGRVKYKLHGYEFALFFWAKRSFLSAKERNSDWLYSKSESLTVAPLKEQLGQILLLLLS